MDRSILERQKVKLKVLRTSKFESLSFGFTPQHHKVFPKALFSTFAE